MNLPVKSRHIMILTGELSGDMHAAKLVSELKMMDPSIRFTGIGGPGLEQQGVDLFFHISNLSVMGATEVISQFGKIKAAFNIFRQKMAQGRCDLLIVVDYPGFNLKAAQYAKTKYQTPVFYFIPPKVWAWKKSRLKQIRAFVDHTALILPFEDKIYKKAGIPATYVGNPLIDEYPEYLTKPFLKNQTGGEGGREILTIALLPGSRKSEVGRLLGIMLDTAIQISNSINPVKFIVSKAESMSYDSFQTICSRHAPGLDFTIHSGPVKDIFQRSGLVIAASGTVTLEAAICCVPTILIYKMSPVSYRLAKILVKLKYVGLANLIVGQEVMPEFLQDAATPDKISEKVFEILDKCENYENRLFMVRRLLGGKGASKRAAFLARQLIDG